MSALAGKRITPFSPSGLALFLFRVPWLGSRKTIGFAPILNLSFSDFFFEKQSLKKKNSLVLESFSDTEYR